MKDSPNAAEKRPLLDALAALRDVPAPMGDAAAEAERRSRIAARVLLASRAAEQGPRRGKMLWVWLAAAVSLGGWLVVLATGNRGERAEPLTAHAFSPALSQAPVIATPAGARTPEPALELLSGELERATAGANAPTWTAAERSLVRLGGVELEFAPQTRVQLKPNAELPAQNDLQVLEGRVSVLGGGAQSGVRIVTESIRIDAMGARFSVSLMSGDTRVDVKAGTVNVEKGGRSQKLEAGSSWQSRAAQVGGAGSAATAEPVEPTDSRQSALADQNQRFQAAMLAKQRGLDGLALEQLDLLLGAHPRGALSESARVERFRILQRSGATERAKGAARAYLSAHPAGFAREEAERVLGTTP